MLYIPGKKLITGVIYYLYGVRELAETCQAMSE
jgi:hypothetical protein